MTTIQSNRDPLPQVANPATRTDPRRSTFETTARGADARGPGAAEAAAFVARRKAVGPAPSPFADRVGGVRSQTDGRSLFEARDDLVASLQGRLGSARGEASESGIAALFGDVLREHGFDPAAVEDGLRDARGLDLRGAAASFVEPDLFSVLDGDPSNDPEQRSQSFFDALLGALPAGSNLDVSA
jgi:hypothetical protein